MNLASSPPSAFPSILAQRTWQGGSKTSSATEDEGGGGGEDELEEEELEAEAGAGALVSTGAASTLQTIRLFSLSFLPSLLETRMGIPAPAEKESNDDVWCANRPWSGSATLCTSSGKSMPSKSLKKSSEVQPGRSNSGSDGILDSGGARSRGLGLSQTRPCETAEA